MTWLELVRLDPAGYSQAITLPPRENEDEEGELQFGVGRLQHRSSAIVLSSFKEMVAGVGLLAAKPGRRGTVKYPVGITSVPDRTKEEVQSGMVEVFWTGVNFRGIKGPSPLINLPGFDIVWSFSPDYMHCVLLGVTRQFLELWLSNAGAAYYIGSPQLQEEIDERLCHIKPPQCMPRLPRSVKLRKCWKAIEWQQWLIYFSLACTDGILPDRYLTHFSLLVRGIFLLLQDEVSYHCVSSRRLEGSCGSDELIEADASPRRSGCLFASGCLAAFRLARYISGAVLKPAFIKIKADAVG
ncbi:hypothetical protein HPB47_014600 [Ixodes persulcatus]|uniref:Uncharacterized protein n=1 Tax=Ixodes persulcatus TaxID=34615 RepID=A0AC60QVN7_IXOPE|nr:hypothetical protein HPB47_014600 [Ixodes persulcatus]